MTRALLAACFAVMILLSVSSVFAGNGGYLFKSDAAEENSYCNCPKCAEEKSKLCPMPCCANKMEAEVEVETIPLVSETELNLKAVAEVSATKLGVPLRGVVSFTQTAIGLTVTAEFSGVDVAGKHGFHVHENGDCADEGKAAGGHFNPIAVQHGFLPEHGHNHAHMGDMGNVEIGVDGKGSLSLLMPGLTIKGPNGIEGKAVILHEKEDDFGQPTGNAGGRIGCGIIKIVE